MLSKAIRSRLLLLLLPGLPFGLLLAAGFWWVWQQQYLVEWVSLLLTCSGLAWILTQHLNRRSGGNVWVTPINPDTPFSQLDQQAWKAVEEQAERLKQEPREQLEHIDTWLDWGKSVLALVAQQYRPKSKKPELEFPVTELLRLVEWVSHDMHKQLNEKIPFSHQITLADGLHFQTWLERLSHANTVVRLGGMVLNPVSGVLNEAKNYAQSKSTVLTLTYFQNWLVETYVKKVGYYAILLYSGRMQIEPGRSQALSPRSRRDLHQARSRQQAAEQEPLRILVAGQTNAGKSTLINTLFDKPRAAADIVSCTTEMTPYQLERGGKISGLIFDTPGYGENDSWWEDNQQELDKTDLLLLVCQANSAARQADFGFLQVFRQHFAAQIKRQVPPLIVVVTHIDQLPPVREWNPPYDLDDPQTPKAVNIRAVSDTLKEELELSENAILVPISLADNDGAGSYNIDALVVAMELQMDGANRARLLRCVGDAYRQEKLSRLWGQLRYSGRWLLGRANKLLP